MNLNLEPRKVGWVLLAGLVCGAIVWGLSVPLTGMREPFDSPSYYYMVAMFIAGLVAALPAPRYWWAAVVGIFLGENANLPVVCRLASHACNHDAVRLCIRV